MNSTVLSRESILSLSSTKLMMAVHANISMPVCVDTYGGSTDHIYTVSYCPQLWCNTHFSLRLFSSLLSLYKYIFYSSSQTGTHMWHWFVWGAWSWFIFIDRRRRRAQTTTWPIIRMTIIWTECESNSSDERDMIDSIIVKAQRRRDFLCRSALSVSSCGRQRRSDDSIASTR